MKRLTGKNQDGSIFQPDSTSWASAFSKLAQYEDTGMEPEEIQAMLHSGSSRQVKKAGEWIAFKDEKGSYRHKCSACGSVMKRGYKQSHFCPDCGACLLEV